jgi:hypothetical protein
MCCRVLGALLLLLGCTARIGVAEDAATIERTDPDAGLPRSPGSVTLRMTLAPGTSFCQTCDEGDHITVRSMDGLVISIPHGGFSCDVDCDTCGRRPCALRPSCPPSVHPTRDQQLAWDGMFSVWSTCGSPPVSCSYSIYRFVPPGRYVARMCATRGTIIPYPAQEGGDRCRESGSPECIEVPFDFPSDTPVEGVLGEARDQ